MSTVTAEPETERRKRDAEALVLLLLLGSSLNWTDAQLVTLSAVTPTSIARAVTLWTSLAPRIVRNALTAGTWSPRDQSYVVTDGPLSPAELKSLSLAFAVAVADKLKEDTAPLLSGDATIGQWQKASGATIKAAITAQTAFAAGGVSEVKLADERAIEDATQDALAKLDNFARQAEDQDSRAGSEAIIVNRIGLYAANTNNAYEAQRRVSHKRAVDDFGNALFIQERNVLANVEHCSTSGGVVGCTEETARGWVGIGSLSLPGERRCAANCKCQLKYRKRP